jgi:hypothetical protein
MLFKINKNNIVTNKTNYIDNRQYNFVSQLDESNLIKYVLKDDTYVFVVQYDNIGHFFHDHFSCFIQFGAKKSTKF